MKKITPNGKLVKELREQLEKGSLQKEMSHAIGISERSLRSIENDNAAISIPLLERIAEYLGVSREDIAYAIDAPKLVPPASVEISDVLLDLGKDRLIPRFERDFAYATMDEGQLFEDAKSSEDLTVFVGTALTDETSSYVEELTRLLSPLTWTKRDWLAVADPAEEIATRRKLRQLLVMLKGNDVWLYYIHQLRRLPERFTEAPKDEPYELKFRLVLAFGPPGEYGEVSMEIDVDNGQPWLLEGWKTKRRAD